MPIDWTKPQEKIATYFTIKDAIYLPQWNRLSNFNDGLSLTVKNNLLTVFAKMDDIRKHFNKPIIIHVAYRPPTYNALVKGAKASAHLSGMAVDFHVDGLSCDSVRKELDDGLLKSLALRYEDLPGSNWVHIDTRWATGTNHMFKP
jgi:uncharacterized protein YcbK (DUF882 family)